MNIIHETIRQTIIDYVAPSDSDAFICVTPWANGEGFDADAHEAGCTHLFQLTWQQWDILKKAVKASLKAE